MQPDVVRAAGEGHREGRLLRLAHLVDRLLERGEVGVAHLPAERLRRERGRLAVVVEDHRDPQRIAAQLAHLRGRGEGHPEQAVRAVQLAGRELVAHDGPRRLLLDDHVHAVLRVEPELVRHHDARAVGQRDEAELDRLLVVRCAGVGLPGIGGLRTAGASGDEAGAGGASHAEGQRSNHVSAVPGAAAHVVVGWGSTTMSRRAITRRVRARDSSRSIDGPFGNGGARCRKVGRGAHKRTQHVAAHWDTARARVRCGVRCAPLQSTLLSVDQ